MIIIGGGVLGMSLANELSKSTFPSSIQVLEAGELGGGLAQLSAGMVRVFHQNPRVSDLALASISTLQRVAEFDARGSLCLIPKRLVDYAKKEVARLRSTGYSIHLLTAEEVQSQFQITTEGMGVFEPEAGSLNPSGQIKRWAKEFVQRGGKVQTGSPVQELIFSRNRIVGVQTATQTITDPNIILAQGTQIEKVAEQIGVSSLGTIGTIQAHIVETDTHRPNIFDYDGRYYFGPIGPNTAVMGLADQPDWFSVKSKFEKLTSSAVQQVREVVGRDRYFADQWGLSGFVCGWQGIYLHTGWGGGAFKLSPALAQKAARQIEGQKNAT